MKKIIIISVLSLVLVSCNWEIKNDKIETTEKKVSVENKVEVQENVAWDIENIWIENKKITVSDLEKNISKLKEIDFNSEDLRMLNEQAIWMFNNSVTNEAIKKLDINICDKTDKNYSDNCKMQVLRKIWDAEKCNIFTETWVLNNCEMEIFKTNAQKNLDEAICEKITEKFEINNCKNSVLEQKAIKNLDSNICNKITEKSQIDMCVELVKMEQENNKMLEEMKKQEEELKKQEEKRKIEEEKNKKQTNENNVKIEKENLVEWKIIMWNVPIPTE